MSLKVGVVGATGMVGATFLKLIEARQFAASELRLFASPKSAGQKLKCLNQEWTLQPLRANCFTGLDLVFFSSGDEISKEWAPQAVQQGAYAVDNSGAFRMSPEHKLVVPEVNGDLLNDLKKPEVIANPNCSTIQLVVALHALAKEFKIEGVRVATYQAVSGAGAAGQQELLDQVDHPEKPAQHEAFAHDIAFNCLPHIGSFAENGFCSEELKIMRESRKILNLPELFISAFTVRVPVMNGHSEAVWVTFDKEIEKTQIENALKKQTGLTYVPHDSPSSYPHQKQVDGQDDVFVGRLHRDLYDPKTWIFWVVADNLLKGAALNGLQIAERIKF